jgi:REP element-mobilizing transposase RayT
MPRQARLDAPGTLHHVILRGLDRGKIVVDAEDRAAFVHRLGAVATATGTTLYAWALLPNHAHLLLRSGPTGLPRFMRRFLTGYAITVNRRHKRVGHLF